VEVGIANQESVMMLNDRRTAPCLDAHVDAIDQAAASLLLGDASIVVRANPAIARHKLDTPRVKLYSFEHSHRADVSTPRNCLS